MNYEIRYKIEEDAVNETNSLASIFDQQNLGLSADNKKQEFTNILINKCRAKITLNHENGMYTFTSLLPEELIRIELDSMEFLKYSLKSL